MFETLATWLWHQRESAEHDIFDNVKYERLAHEIGVSVAQLEELIDEAQDPNALPVLLQQLPIDEVALADAEPVLSREMRRKFH